MRGALNLQREGKTDKVREISSEFDMLKSPLIIVVAKKTEAGSGKRP
jgi:hypothetical protein